MMRKGMRGFMPLAVAGILSVGLVACGGDDDEEATPTAEPTAAATTESAPGGAGTVSVTVDGTTTEGVGVSDALVAVSDAAGFDALPVQGLPDGFVLTALMVEEEGSTKVIKGEVEGPSGTAIVTQVNEKQQIPGGTVIQTAAGRAYYEVASGDGVTYYLVTADKTYSIVLEDADLLARDQAMEVLRAFILV